MSIPKAGEVWRNKDGTGGLLRILSVRGDIVTGRNEHDMDNTYSARGLMENCERVTPREAEDD